MTYRKRKGIRTAILALATAAILVPVAQAYPSYGSGSEAQSYTPQALNAMVQRWDKIAEHYQATSPDDRGGIKGVGQTAQATSDYVDRQVANLEAKSSSVVHVDDRSGVRGPGPVETPVLVTSHGDGFDWTDAGIGASVVLFAAAMLAAAMLAARRLPGIPV
jgi:hypothetical protein